MYTLALIVNLCGFLWAAGIATRLRTIQAGPLMQMPVFLLLFLAPVYVPLALLGDTLHAIARFNPLTYALESGRGFLAGDPMHVALGVRRCRSPSRRCFTVWALRGLRSAEAAG